MNREARLWVSVLLLAGLVRVLWSLLVPVEPVSDSVAYMTFALNLAEHNVYGWGPERPTAWWPVGTSFVYSLAYRAFGIGHLPIVLLNIAMGVGIVAVSMALARRWFGREAAIGAGLLLAFWPLHIQFTTVLASELAFTLLCMAGILAWPQGWSRRWAWRAVLAGVLLAAATYVRPTALLIPVVLAGAAVVRERGLIAPAAALALALAVMAVLIAPWTARNYRHFGEFVLISSNGGGNLWMGNNPETRNIYQVGLPTVPGYNEAQNDRYQRDLAVRYIRAEPLAFVKRGIIRAVRFYERETIGISWNRAGLARAMPPGAITAVKAVGQGYWIGALALGLCGIALLVRREGLGAAVGNPGLAFVVYLTAVHAVTVFQDRYHFPVTPVVAALGGATLAWMWRSRSAAGGRRAGEASRIGA